MKVYIKDTIDTYYAYRNEMIIQRGDHQSFTTMSEQDLFLNEMCSANISQYHYAPNSMEFLPTLLLEIFKISLHMYIYIYQLVYIVPDSNISVYFEVFF